jgi:hypothetical protein
LSNFGAGGAQAILRDGDELDGASDPRKDGCVLIATASAHQTPNKETDR